MEAGVGGAGQARYGQRQCGQAEQGDRLQQHQHRQQAHLRRFQFAAEEFWRASGHQPGQEHRHHQIDQELLDAAANAAPDRADQHVDDGHHAAERAQRVMHAVDRAVLHLGGDGRPQRRAIGAEAGFLAFHQQCAGGAGAVAFQPQAGTGGQHRHGQHAAEYQRTKAPPSGEAAEHADDGHRDQQDADQFQRIGQRGRVFQREAAVRAIPATAIGAELFGRNHGCDRAERDLLRFHAGTGIDRRGLRASGQCGRHALPVQQQRPHQAQRQQEAQTQAHHVGVVVADGDARCGIAAVVAGRFHEQGTQRCHCQCQPHHRGDHLQAGDAGHL